jgi:hypothetical protein
MELEWERPVFGYLALSGASLLTANVLGTLPSLILLPLFVILGPTAWLLWGFGAAPFYLVATAVFAGTFIGAIFLDLRTPLGGRLVLWFAGIVWLLLGLAARNFNV